MKKVLAFVLVFTMMFSAIAAFSVSAEQWKEGNREIKAVKGTPTIDGNMDDIWKQTEEQAIDHFAPLQAKNTQDATEAAALAGAKFRMLWDADFVYFWFEIHDSDESLVFSNAKKWQNDSMHIFFAENNDGTYQQYLVYYGDEGDANSGSVDYRDGNNAIRPVGAKVVKATKGDNGYDVIIEAKIPTLNKELLKKDSWLAFDIQFNDADPALDAGGQNRGTVWEWSSCADADHTDGAMAESNQGRWGRVVFVETLSDPTPEPEKPELKTGATVDGGTWEVKNGTYTLTETRARNHEGFNTYVLGKSGKKVTLKYDFVVGNGDTFASDAGFLFAVEDLDGDGAVKEGKDNYYLVDLQGNGKVGIEKNVHTWGDWAIISEKTAGNAGETVSLEVTYDPSTHTITVKANGEEILTWQDKDNYKGDPLTGTAYALASKQIAGSKIVKTASPVNTGDAAAIVIVTVAVISLAGAALVAKKRSFEK